MSRSTRNIDIAGRSASSDPVTATRITKSASAAWLMKCLVPRIRQPSPSRVARVRMARMSEPAPGSVIARQSTFSPRTHG